MILENGNVFCFNIPANNSGTINATNTKVQLLLPNGLTFQSATTTLGTYNETTGIWNIGTLLSGSSESLNLCVTITDVNLSAFAIKYIISATEFDTDFLNNLGYKIISGPTCTEIVSCITDAGLDTFAGLADTPATGVGTENWILRYNATGDGVEAVDPSTIGVNTFSTLSGTIITFEDGQTFDLAHTTDTNTFATVLGTVITFADGSTLDISGTNTFATLSGTVITFPDGQTINVQDTDTTYTVGNTDQITMNLSSTNVITATFAPQPTGTEPTVLSYNPSTNTFSWSTVNTGNTSTVNGVLPTGNLIASHDDGTGNIVNIRETITSLVANIDNTNIDYIDESGNTVQVDFTNIVKNLETNTSLSLTGNFLQYVDESGVNNVIDLTGVVTVPSQVINTKSGNRIATHISSSGLGVDINESVTELTFVGDTLTFLDENGSNTVIDLSQYNTIPRSRITTATLSGANLLTLTRDDSTTITVDLSTLAGGKTVLRTDVDYLITTEDLIVVHTNIGTTIYLPSAPTSGTTHTIKQRTTGTIIDGNGNNIDGVTNYTLPLLDQSITVTYDGVEWVII